MSLSVGTIGCRPRISKLWRKIETQVAARDAALLEARNPAARNAYRQRRMSGELRYWRALARHRAVKAILKARRAAAPPKPQAPLPFPSKAILEEVAAKHGTTVDILRSVVRTKPITKARFEACYRLRTELHLSYPQIGKRLGNRDHTSALNGVLMHAERNGLKVPE